MNYYYGCFGFKLSLYLHKCNIFVTIQKNILLCCLQINNKSYLRFEILTNQTTKNIVF